MPSADRTEHFCTLFDSHFLPSGLALHESLAGHAQSFHLWILCMDDRTEEALRTLAPENVSLIPLREMETAALSEVKKERSLREYCWTLTPFIFTAVFDRDPDIRRVTYLDADLYFFDDPRILLKEMDAEEKTVLITHHAPDPRYDSAPIHGKYCVQFVTFGRDAASVSILDRWQRDCLAWCFARYDVPGRFGDQMYLDGWPEDYPDAVHVVTRTDRTLAPWNVHYFSGKIGAGLRPVFYHFHGLRIVSHESILLYIRYHVGRFGDSLYDRYTEALQKQISRLRSFDIPLLPLSMSREKLGWLRQLKRRICGEIRFARIA